jgi:uncharacterized membrane protein YeiH
LLHALRVAPREGEAGKGEGELEREIFRVLDWVGIVAFAMSGAFKAIRHRLDLLGLLVLGFCTAMGGGLVRDSLLNRLPAVFLANAPALFALAGCLLAALWHVYGPPSSSIEQDRRFLFVDAVGLAVFTVTGARLGTEAGLLPWAAILLGGLTAVGGGAIRDVLVLEVPLVLKADFYATASLIGGFVYTLMARHPDAAPLAGAAAFVVTLFLRTMAILKGWRLPSLPKRD